MHQSIVSFLSSLKLNLSLTQVKSFNDNLFFQSARFWFLLLDDLDFSEEAIKLMEEVRMSRQVLELGDIRLLASIHKTHLNDVLARVNKIVED